MQLKKHEPNFTIMERKCIKEADGLTINKFYRVEPIDNKTYKVYNDKRKFGVYSYEIFEVITKQINYAKAY